MKFRQTTKPLNLGDNVHLSYKTEPATLFDIRELDKDNQLNGMDFSTRFVLLHAILIYIEGMPAEKGAIETYNQDYIELFYQWAPLKLWENFVVEKSFPLGEFEGEYTRHGERHVLDQASTYDPRQKASIRKYGTIASKISATQLPVLISPRGMFQSFEERREKLYKRLQNELPWFPTYEILMVGYRAYAKDMGLSTSNFQEVNVVKTWKKGKSVSLIGSGGKIMWGPQELLDLLTYYNIGKLTPRGKATGFRIDFIQLRNLLTHMKQPEIFKTLFFGPMQKRITDKASWEKLGGNAGARRMQDRRYQEKVRQRKKALQIP